MRKNTEIIRLQQVPTDTMRQFPIFLIVLPPLSYPQHFRHPVQLIHINRRHMFNPYQLNHAEICLSSFFHIKILTYRIPNTKRRCRNQAVLFHNRRNTFLTQCLYNIFCQLRSTGRPERSQRCPAIIRQTQMYKGHAYVQLLKYLLSLCILPDESLFQR